MRKKILVVDDEPDFTQMLRIALESLGKYEVVEVNESSLALKEARQFLPDLILMDVMMPEPDGSELAAMLRTDPYLRNTPIIFLTALASREERLEPSLGLGHRVYLPKPFEWNQLIEWIERETEPSRI